MGYYSTTELELNFETESDAEALLTLLDKPDIPMNPLTDNLDITPYMYISGNQQSTQYSVTLKDCVVKMGEYKEWIPIVAEAEGLIDGTMYVFGEEPGDLWKVEFENGEYQAFIGEIEYSETELKYM
jgi:hypothetical protein